MAFRPFGRKSPSKVSQYFYQVLLGGKFYLALSSIPSSCNTPKMARRTKEAVGE
ncbi:hypothetical protein CAEBREN_12156 [Caenorhabditis brenneri]|uniref:Uncharacterized protein n=1 Tax=Caenorhabditis brenneri TaxID=135651 RepID=G0M6Q6_CAEBE|nr:hypothetical protein CAEBREN_12156 [Caenorhabditis brenneri]